jgi:hypothetical protein
MNRKPLLPLTVLVAVTALVAGCGPPPGEAEQAEWASTAPSAISQPELMTWWPRSRVGVSTRTQIGLAVPKVAREVEKVTIYVPTGYALDPGASPGTGEGHVFFGADSDSGDGALKAVDPQLYENSPQAQACAPGQHQGVWVASLEFGAGTWTIPFYVDPTSGPETALGDYELQACLPLAHLSSPGGTPLGSSMRYLVIAFTGLTAPASSQLTIWHAYLSNPDGTGTPDPTTTYELRTDQPLPASLGLTARLNRRHHRAQLSGQLTASSISVAGVPVTLYRVCSCGGLERVARTNTLLNGTFRFSRPLRRTTRYEVEAGGSTGACRDASTAPMGCVDETLEFINSPRVRVVLPRRR